MSEMVERVARALREQYDNRTTFEVTPRFSVMARAAIGALRRPTLAMAVFGDTELAKGFDTNSQDVWTAMIDAALKEPA